MSAFVKIVAFSFKRGGAAKAAARFSGLVGDKYRVKNVAADECCSPFQYYLHLLKRLVSYALVFPFAIKSPVKLSANIFGCSKVLACLSKDANTVFNIHWINNDSLSVFDFKKIPLYSIITLHDEWLYCGVEHYFNPKKDFSLSPYVLDSNKNRCHYSFLHKWVWYQKKKAFSHRKDLIITCPSRWLADRAKSSKILGKCDIRVLYNPVDTSLFEPLSHSIVKSKRHELGVDGKFFLIFGAVGGSENTLKGFDKVASAMEILASDPDLNEKLALGFFGGEKKGIKEFYGFSVHEFGYINSEEYMAKIYSVAHATLVPSIVEAFGQVAAESQSCGTPVISFDTSGLRDVVIPGVTGMLADPFSPESLADCIRKMVYLPLGDYQEISLRARQYVVENFSNSVVCGEYNSIIDEQVRNKLMVRDQ